MKVKVEGFEYVLDWFEVTEVEIDLSKYSFFEVQFRTGEWYLMHYIIEDGKSINTYDDFQLSSPKKAIKVLGNKLKKFSSLHAGGEAFTKNLRELLND